MKLTTLFFIAGNLVSAKSEDQSFIALIDKLNMELEQVSNKFIIKDLLAMRMARYHINLFAKWENLMIRCKNGDMRDSIPAHVPDIHTTDEAEAKYTWNGLMVMSFEVCDRPITRRGFANSSWKRRIENYFYKLNSLIGRSGNASARPWSN